MILGIEDKWEKYPGIEGKAKESGASSVYQRIYRLACEPAHVADLQEYMPLPDGTVWIQQNQVLALRPYMAIEYGLWMMTDLLAEVSEFYGLGLESKVGELRVRIEDLRKSPRN